jgi:uncharacterized MAPEG superfamily protein
MYQFAKGMTASNYTATNIVPRTNLELLKPKLDSATWSRLARARGAHLNGLESFHLFAAAMIAGNYAGMEVKELNFCAVEYLVATVVFTALYMGVARSEAWSYARSGVYMWSVGIPMYVLWKAGGRLVERL